MKKGQIYKHCKGKLYKIVALARNSDNCKQEIVVYKSLEHSDYPKGTLWTRPLEDFNSIHRSGLKRFQKIKG